MANSEFVQIKVKQLHKGGSTITYPQVTGIPNQAAAAHMNTLIHDATQELIQAQHAEQGAPYFQEMIGSFEIKNNQRGILSIVLTNYAYAPLHAHGLTLAKSLTFSVDNGKLINLRDLFKPNSNYEFLLARFVQQQAAIRNIPLLTDQVTVRRDQDFYLADKSLVIYYQAYGITPGYVGLPSFVMPEYTLSPIVDQNGPLGQLAEGL